MPATNFMSALMLDPRAFMLNPLFCDPAALALLQQQVPFASLPTEQHAGGGKVVGSTANETSTTTSSSSTSAANSFRILDILESQARSNHSTSSSGGSEKANTSGENGKPFCTNFRTVNCAQHFLKSAKNSKHFNPTCLQLSPQVFGQAGNGQTILSNYPFNCSQC